MEFLRPEDVGSDAPLPPELDRIVGQNLVTFEPWYLLSKDDARQRYDGLQGRYQKRYFPFAHRQDNDDVACLDSSRPGVIIVVHDFASEGWQERKVYQSFWDWFRSAIEDMIEF